MRQWKFGTCIGYNQRSQLTLFLPCRLCPTQRSQQQDSTAATNVVQAGSLLKHLHRFIAEKAGFAQHLRINACVYVRIYTHTQCTRSYEISAVCVHIFSINPRVCSPRSTYAFFLIKSITNKYLRACKSHVCI